MSDLGLMCMIALGEFAELEREAVARAIAAASPRAAVRVEARAAGRGESAVWIEIDRHPMVALAVGGALPEPELAEALRASLFWRGAAAEMARHTAFVALAAVEPARGLGLVRAQAVALTRAAAGLVEALPALGLYWRGALSMVPPERAARAPGQIGQDRWPVDMWVGYHLFGDIEAAGGMVLGVQTRGAAAYLGYELEVPPFRTDDRGAPLRILWNAVGHLLAMGDVLRDGQLVEVTGERRTRYRVHLGRDGRPGLAQLTVLSAADGG